MKSFSKIILLTIITLLIITGNSIRNPQFDTDDDTIHKERKILPPSSYNNSDLGKALSAIKTIFPTFDISLINRVKFFTNCGGKIQGWNFFVLFRLKESTDLFKINVWVPKSND